MQIAPSSPTEQAPVSRIFAALAAELDLARALTMRVEEAVCALSQRFAVGGAATQDLQQLDFVLQHLSALRDFAAEIALTDPVDGAIAIDGPLARIGLEDVRTRLAGRDVAPQTNDLWEEF